MLFVVSGDLSAYPNLASTSSHDTQIRPPYPLFPVVVFHLENPISRPTNPFTSPILCSRKPDLI